MVLLLLSYVRARWKILYQSVSDFTLEHSLDLELQSLKVAVRDG